MLLASGSQDNYIRVWRISSRVDYKKSNGGTVDDDLKLKEDNFTVTSRGMFYSQKLTFIYWIAYIAIIYFFVACGSGLWFSFSKLKCVLLT